MTEARDKALRERKAKRNPNRCNPDTEFTLGFDAGAEEVGRLEREVATLRAEKDSPHADAKYWMELQTERAGRAKDYEWMKARVGKVAAELWAALAAIERVLNLTGDIGPEARRILTHSPTDALAEVKATVWGEGWHAGWINRHAAKPEFIDGEAHYGAQLPIVNPYQDAKAKCADDRLAEAHRADLKRQSDHYTNNPQNADTGSDE